MRVAFWGLVLVAGFAFATVWMGWWAVPVVGLAAGLVVPDRLRPMGTIPAAAGMGWMLLLLRAARADGFGALAEQLELLLRVPLPGLVAATLLLPALTAAGAALLGRSLRAAWSGRR
jgi:hypothetical protein